MPPTWQVTSPCFPGEADLEHDAVEWVAEDKLGLTLEDPPTQEAPLFPPESGMSVVSASPGSLAAKLGSRMALMPEPLSPSWVLANKGQSWSSIPCGNRGTYGTHYRPSCQTGHTQGISLCYSFCREDLFPPYVLYVRVLAVHESPAQMPLPPQGPPWFFPSCPTNLPRADHTSPLILHRS